MIKAYDVEIPNPPTGGAKIKKGGITDDVLSFYKSDSVVAEIEVRSTKKAAHVASNYSAAIKRLGLENEMKALKRSEQVFLMKVR